MEQATESPQVHRRLTRLNDGRIFAGVANGIGEYLDVDPWLVRAAFFLFSFVGGTGIIAYIAALILMPQETDPVGSAVADRWFTGPVRRGPFVYIGVLLLGFFVLHSIQAVHGVSWWPWLFVVVGLYLFKDRWANKVPVATESAAEPALTTPAYGQPSSHRRTRTPRARSPLGLMTMGISIAAFGVAVALAQSGTVHLRIQQLLAVPLIVLGIGVLVGTLFGRARWLVLPAVMLMPFLVAASVADVPFHATAGQRIYRPLQVSEIQSSYTLGAGRMVLNLASISSLDGAKTVTVTQGAGELVVVVPRNIAVAVNASEGAGVIDMLGRRTNGFSPHLSQSATGAGPVLQLNIRDGFGRTFVTDDENAPEVHR